MGYYFAPDGEAMLQVRAELADTTPRSLDIVWTPVSGSVAGKKLVCARIFLVPLANESHRMYLSIVDGRRSISLELSGSLSSGEYAIEVDAYGNAGWTGFGKLDARGRSAPFMIGPSVPA